MSTHLIDALRANLPADVTVDSYVDEGGQGAVFQGTVKGATAAIKVFSPHGNPRRLERELSLLRSIDCPHLVRILWDGSVDLGGLSCSIVGYEFHPGGDLRRLLTPHNPHIDANALIQLAAHISEAVEALWTRRIVHRDIKPGNIVQASDGRFVLVDVGLARHLDRSDLTAAGVSPGTSGYKSPEQANGRRNLTVHSDWFSLGVTLYEIATRRHPFGRRQPMFGMASPPPLTTLRPDVPPSFSRLIVEMIAERPANRPRDVNSRIQQLIP